MRRADERGVALALAIFAIAVTGLLVAAVFGGARGEQRAGEDSLYGQQAFEAAEGGLAAGLDGWNQPTYGAFPLGAPQLIGTETIGRVRVTTSVTRLTGTLFLVTALGERASADGRVLARRRLGMVVRWDADSAAGAIARLTERAWVRLYD